MTIAAFDIELFDIVDLPPNGDLNSLGPFDLSIAAAVDADGHEWTWPFEVDDGLPGGPLSAEHSKALLEHLAQMQDDGCRVVAWNGVSFDLRWLGVASGELDLARSVARRSYDPMLQLFCLRGFPLALAKVAEGMGVSFSKTMHGAEEPVAWQEGRTGQVREYVLNDCRMTLDVFKKIEQQRGVRWTSKAGRPTAVDFSPLCVEECLGLPLPDTSWMASPLSREGFIDWLNAAWVPPVRAR